MCASTSTTCQVPVKQTKNVMYVRFKIIRMWLRGHGYYGFDLNLWYLVFRGDLSMGAKKDPKKDAKTPSKTPKKKEGGGGKAKKKKWSKGKTR